MDISLLWNEGHWENKTGVCIHVPDGFSTFPDGFEPSAICCFGAVVAG